MVEIEKLNRGDVVRLVSGSPYMTVRGFKPVAAPPHGKPLPRTHITVILWSQRHGFIEKDFAPWELMIPLRQAPRDTEEPSD